MCRVWLSALVFILILLKQVLCTCLFMTVTRCSRPLFARSGSGPDLFEEVPFLCPTSRHSSFGGDGGEHNDFQSVDDNQDICSLRGETSLHGSGGDLDLDCDPENGTKKKINMMCSAVLHCLSLNFLFLKSNVGLLNATICCFVKGIIRFRPSFARHPVAGTGGGGFQRRKLQHLQQAGRQEEGGGLLSSSARSIGAGSPRCSSRRDEAYWDAVLSQGTGR